MKADAVEKMKKNNLKKYGVEYTSQIFRGEKKIEKLISELKEIYNKNNNLDFSKIEYFNNTTKIEIFCKKHGSFKITPTNLLKGYGCKKCNKEENAKIQFIKYIEKFNKIHNNKYDYSKINYTEAHKKGTIICPIRGEFNQKIIHHANGQACPKCSLGIKTNSQFIEESNKIHNNKYDYSQLIYINTQTKIKIICPEHGLFTQYPSHHINGNGCRKCAYVKSRLRRLEQISKDKFEGNQIIPAYNKKACILFDKISKKENLHIQHAMNGGEYYISKLGYWLDGYDLINNVAYEYDEKFHFIKNKLSEKDIGRQKEIEKHLKCKFIRIKDL